PNMPAITSYLMESARGSLGNVIGDNEVVSMIPTAKIQSDDCIPSFALRTSLRSSLSIRGFELTRSTNSVLFFFLLILLPLLSLSLSGNGHSPHKERFDFHHELVSPS